MTGHASTSRVRSWLIRKWLLRRGITLDANGAYFAKHGLDAGTPVRSRDA